MRSRSFSMAARSIAGSVMGTSLDAEEQVEVAVGGSDVAADGAGVAAAEGGEHEAARVELDHGAQVVDGAGLEGDALGADAHPVLAGVAAGDAQAERERLGRAGDVRGGLPQ